MKLSKTDLSMSIVITYEKYTLRVLSVTKVKGIIDDAEMICASMCKTIITNDNNAYYTDAVGNMYLHRNFTKEWIEYCKIINNTP